VQSSEPIDTLVQLCKSSLTCQCRDHCVTLECCGDSAASQLTDSTRFRPIRTKTSQVKSQRDEISLYQQWLFRSTPLIKMVSVSIRQHPSTKSIFRFEQNLVCR